MKISLNWLREYVHAGISYEKLAHKLTMAGLEVENISTVDGDKVFELEITPNRADCLSFIGIAREVSAILNTPLKSISGKKVSIPRSKVNVVIEDKQGCSRYIGALIENVKITQAPASMIKRLESIGGGAINNVVDITNFCLMETGQPLHAFDYDKLIGGKIIVRRAKKGERIITIDGSEHALDPSILVIADAKRPVAIAGIMGGQETEVAEDTQNILLESACFDPALIRAGVRSLGLSSDSSYRFERGVDTQAVKSGAVRALSLISEHAGGALSAFSDVSGAKKKATQSSIHISIDDIECLLGTSLGLSKSQTILKRLGFRVVKVKNNMLKVFSPSFRPNIFEKVDIVEEIARVIGYDNIPQSLPVVKASGIKESRSKMVVDNVRETILAQGFSEAITYAMVSQEKLDRAHQGSLKALKVKNPLSLDQEVMRPSLAPGLLSVVVSNINRGEKNIRLFEIGKTYSPSGENDVLALIATGERLQDWRQSQKEEVDFYDLKGATDAVLRKNRIESYTFDVLDNEIFQKGQCACLKTGAQEVGALGLLSKGVLRDWNIKQKKVWFAQIDLSWIQEREPAGKEYQSISEFPSMVRDVSLAIKEETHFRDVENIIAELKPGFLSEVKFVEEYRGDKVPSGHRGVVFSLVYQDPSRTLREEDVNSAHEKICQAMIDRLGAIKR